MRSPVGWALANVFYDKHVGMPDPGSWQEALMLLTWSQRQLGRSAEARFITQAIMTPNDEKVVVEAQEDFLEALFPYYRQQQVERKKHMLSVLKRWTSMGPIAVQPLVSPAGNVREQKMLARGRQAQESRKKEVDAGRMVRFSSKLWREWTGAVPVRERKARRPE